MKITRTAKDVQKIEKRRQKAREGCDVCPCCGNTDIRCSIYPKYVLRGFFKLREVRIDRYNCDTCGAEWESEPFEELQD